MSSGRVIDAEPRRDLFRRDDRIPQCEQRHARTKSQRCGGRGCARERDERVTSSLVTLGQIASRPRSTSTYRHVSLLGDPQRLDPASFHFGSEDMQRDGLIRCEDHHPDLHEFAEIERRVASRSHPRSIRRSTTGNPACITTANTRPRSDASG